LSCRPRGGLPIGLGVVAALAVVALDIFLFAPLVAQTMSAPPFWTGALAALCGGLAEEILLRYGAMSFLAWLLTRVASGPTAYWARSSAPPRSSALRTFQRPRHSRRSS
jgi:hypothetical protein